MYRMTLVLLLLAVKLPMTAEEASGVTVHQAEWGDTRGEAPPPSGPIVPIKSNAPAPEFQRKAFSYGQGLRYSQGIRYGQSMRYQPNTRQRGVWRLRDNAYRPNIQYRGAGRRMRSGTYQPKIRYGTGVQQNQNDNRYRFGN